MARINEKQRQAVIAGHETRPIRRRRQQSYAERYRGTEFETVKYTAPAGEPVVSRGRAFVLVTGAATIGFCGLVVHAALSA